MFDAFASRKIIDIHTNKTHFKKKSFALGFTLKARVFVTRKIAH